MKWRLGLDLGANSLGWCAVELTDQNAASRIIALGTRIFSDGRDAKSKQSLAVDRREARAMRRRRDRFKQRQDALLKHLTALGLFPGDEAGRKSLSNLDPFELRARALDQALTPYELGRALFHLNQRRGFKSNRKADRKADESGKIRVGVRRLVEQMNIEGARTFGEFLHHRRQKSGDPNRIESVRTRLRPEAGEGAKGDGYDFYPDRALLEEECKEILELQSAFHPSILTDDAQSLLFDLIFHQRPLKPAKVGLCTLLYETGEERLAKAHPLFQQRRLLEEVNALRIMRPGEVGKPLCLSDRDALIHRLKTSKSVSFEQLRRKVLKLDPEARFNKESENRKELKGDEVAAVMADKKRFGARWGFLTLAEQWRLIQDIQGTESDADVQALEQRLIVEHKLTADQAAAVINAPLPEGHGRFGETATRKLIEALTAAKPDGTLPVYSEAVEIADLGHHSDFRTGEVFNELPYYGVVLARHILPGTGDPDDYDELRYGKLTNPTVHIGLNQLRRVMNRLIKAFGPPTEVALELARELKLSEEEKAKLNQLNRRNREDAEKRSAKLGELGVADKGGNRAIIKLWEELNRENVLDRRCVYTGQQISQEMLFSGAVEVDHILPFHATLDDSQGNRILCVREANREKRKQSPYDAFGHTDRWEDISARAARLPKEKRWRFEPDAMERFEKDGGFLARQLIDTQYLARLAREYVSALYPGKGEGSSHVWVTPGRLTEMLRRSWGLNSLLPDHNFGGGADQPKNRLDHRHHAIDAAVIAVTDLGLLQRLARESGRKGHEEARKLAHDHEPPWPNFRAELGEKLTTVVASHRTDHGTVSKASRPKGWDATAGRLHNDTAYGLTGREENGVPLVVHRVPLTSLKPDDLADSGRRIADPHLRQRLRTETIGREGKDFLAALARFSATDEEYRGLRRVRVIEPLAVIPIRDKSGRAYKGYKGDSNYRYDVWELSSGKWVAEIVSMFDAHRPDWKSQVRANNHNARKVLSLQIDDLLACDRDGDLTLHRVVKFSNGQIVLAKPNEAGDLKRRHDLADDPFRYVFASASALKHMNARQIRVDELGRIMDPGPRTKLSAAA